MRVTKFIFTVCAILLLVLFANGMYVLSLPGGNGHRPAPVPISEYKGQSSKETKFKHSNFNQPDFRQLESSTSEEIPLNLLVLGLDKDGTRCDVIMLFNFEPGLSKINLLSIARDTRVLDRGKYGKINALYSRGGEKLVAEEVTEITGLPVHYYLTVDFKGFRKIIDTLGGVQFYVPFRMSYDDPTQDLYIHLRKGMQLLNGKKAEQLVRYRKGNYKGQGYTEGDIGRIKMQQDFLKALIKQKVSFRYISRVDDIFGILRKYVKTNITLSDITHYLGSIGKIKADEIETFTIPGDSRMIGDTWYFIYDRDKVYTIINDNFYK